MKNFYIILFLNIMIFSNCTSQNNSDSENTNKVAYLQKEFKPKYLNDEALKIADSILSEMTLEQKIEFIGGHNYFFVEGVEKYNIPRLYLADATQGVHIRKNLDSKLEKSTSFPAPICLTSAWNTNLAYNYAHSVGEECRLGDIAVLLGPGMNIYRNSQNGRNFEYFGEDPFLAARLIENYVVGVQNTGTIATLKHFMCNNTDYYRRTSNSIVDERTLHEIYLPAFKAGVDAGAMAVMTSYNQINGEWAGQSEYVINTVLRQQLGFKWLVMTDWWSVWDPEKAIKSGLDLDMPGHGRLGNNNFLDFGNPFLRSNAKKLVDEGKVSEEDIHRMARNVIALSIGMGLHERPVIDKSLENNFSDHKEIALQTAREGIVLLKNDNEILPIDSSFKKSILLMGQYCEENAHGGGAANVEGYDVVSLKDAVISEFGNNIIYKKKPSREEISEADVVLLSIGTMDSEGWDSDFELPDDVNELILNTAALNKNVIVLMSTGRGVGMTKWIDKVAGLIYYWYPGQIGNVALAEILSGKTNPSGKLPITIEKKFQDSPAYPYIPEGETFYEGWTKDFVLDRPINNIKYDEGVFVGYRWYEQKGIDPLFPFGYGLSYSQFKYSNIAISPKEFSHRDTINVEFYVSNIGKFDGMEICQLYISDVKSSVSRPIKELKGFAKVDLKTGETKLISIPLSVQDFSFYDVDTHTWKAETGEFVINIGSSSTNILLKENVFLK